MSQLAADWWVHDGIATAWFDASSLADGAALAGRTAERSPDASVDLRASGVRVSLGADGEPDAVSTAARDLGLTADRSVLQHLDVVLEATSPPAVIPFWQRVLAYTSGGGGRLTDPVRRDTAVTVRRATEARPLRNRVHLDVVRPAPQVEQAEPGEASGPYGVRHADPEGNEVDLVPGDPLGGTKTTSDWWTVFGAMACYRTTSLAQQHALAAAAADLADDAGFPLLVDLRPGLVVLDSGKDQGDDDAHGLDLDFTDLAGRLQAAARGLGAVADAALPRFVQLFLDAADVAAVRAFWTAVLGYVPDRRPGLSDIHDPRRLTPVLVLQELDASDAARRRQRNRVHLELALPADLARTRVDTAVAAGGRILAESPGRWEVGDPEGNELVVLGRTRA